LLNWQGCFYYFLWGLKLGFGVGGRDPGTFCRATAVLTNSGRDGIVTITVLPNSVCCDFKLLLTSMITHPN